MKNRAALEIPRPEYLRERLRYAGGVTPAASSVIEPHLSARKRLRRPVRSRDGGGQRVVSTSRGQVEVAFNAARSSARLDRSTILLRTARRPHLGAHQLAAQALGDQAVETWV